MIVKQEQLLDEIATQEEQEEEEETPEDQSCLLTRGKLITTKSILLILSKTSDLNHFTLEETLSCSTSWTSPIFRQLIKLKPRRDRVRWVTRGLVVLVPTRSALVDSSVQNSEFLLLSSSNLDRVFFEFGRCGGVVSWNGWAAGRCGLVSWGSEDFVVKLLLFLAISEKLCPFEGKRRRRMELSDRREGGHSSRHVFLRLVFGFVHCLERRTGSTGQGRTEKR